MNYNIIELERNQDGDVLVVHWEVSKTSGEEVAQISGASVFEPDSSSSNYIAYDDLTENNVIMWVQADINTDEIEAKLDSVLTELTAPTILFGKPW
jgi:hypothetical protein